MQPRTRGGWRPRARVELLAGTPPRGGQDRAARALAAALHDELDVPVSVVNVPGRGGADAWASLRAAPDDPNRLAISSPTLITNPVTGVAPIGPADVRAIATLCTEHIVFAVAHDTAIDGPGDLLRAMEAPDDLVTALATARGNVNHIALARLGGHVGIDARRLPVRVFDSARLAIADTVAGNAALVAVSAASVLPEVAAGTLHPIAVSSPTRLTGTLDVVPTWIERGVDCTIGTWRGVVAGPDVPSAAVEGWTDAIARAVRGATWRAALDAHVWSDTFLDAVATDAFLAEQRVRLGTALADLGLARA